MEHPLLPSLDHMTVEELGAKISELNKKLSIAHRMGNAYLCNQIRMAIESHQNKYNEKAQAMFKSANNGKDFDDKIDIS
jgi:hypothetical protein